jgi:hypothetical protein
VSEERQLVEDIARVQRADAAVALIKKDPEGHDRYLLLAAVVWPETDELREMGEETMNYAQRVRSQLG